MPQNDVSLEDAHSELTRDSAYQLELPTDAVITQEERPPEVDGDSFLSSLFGVIADFFSAIGPLLKLAVFIAIGALVIYIIFAIVKGIAVKTSCGMWISVLTMCWRHHFCQRRTGSLRKAISPAPFAHFFIPHSRICRHGSGIELVSR